jgi:DNA polymerase-3 subunit delta
MTEAELEKKLKGGTGLVYLIYGEENLVIEDIVHWLTQKVLNGGVEDLNVDRFKLNEGKIDIEKVMEAMTLMPMLSEKRVVILEGISSFFGGKKKKDKGAENPVLKWLQHPSESHCVILCEYGKLEDAFLKDLALDQNSHLHSFCVSALKESEIKQWIQKECKKLKVKIQDQAMDDLIDCVGEQLAIIRSTLEKLALYVTPRLEIEAKDIKDVLPEARVQTDLFELIDFIFERNATQALLKMHALYENATMARESKDRLIFGTLSNLYQYLKNMILCGVYQHQGLQEKDIIATIKQRDFRQKDFVIRKYLRFLKNFRLDELDILFGELVQTDLLLKSSKLDNDLILENLILKICNVSRNQTFRT